MKKFILLLAISIWILPATLRAQCDTIASLCVKNLTAKYISDGQQYRALLLSKEVAEFNATFYGGTTYRLAACSGLKDGSLEFRIFDKQRNLLFTNIEHKNAPYWDFKFESTMDCIIEAQLIDPNVKSGCAVLLISFKK
ncbi:MAG: hypothetical protein ACK5CO_09415 [Bacteroidota bacterium]|jgi:hypothetical protein